MVEEAVFGAISAPSGVSTEMHVLRQIQIGIQTDNCLRGPDWGEVTASA